MTYRLREIAKEMASWVSTAGERDGFEAPSLKAAT